MLATTMPRRITTMEAALTSLKGHAIATATRWTFWVFVVVIARLTTTEMVFVTTPKFTVAPAHLLATTTLRRRWMMAHVTLCLASPLVAQTPRLATTMPPPNLTTVHAHTLRLLMTVKEIVSTTQTVMAFVTSLKFRVVPILPHATTMRPQRMMLATASTLNSTLTVTVTA
jgi:hypothetical protein